MFFTKKHKVIIKNKNITIEAKSGINLYKLLIDHDIDLQSLCSGNGQCGKCKVHISSDNLLKPTKKERLILARMSLDDGYRLACQYPVKSDIVITTEDYFDAAEADKELFGVKVIDQPLDAEQINDELTPDTVDDSSTTESTDDLNYTQDKNIQESVDTIKPQNDNIDTNADHENTEISNTQAETQKDTNDSVTNEFHPTDGLLLIQYPRGIKYYMYSAGINNVSSDGFIKTDEQIIDLIDNNSICDFLYNCSDIRDIERLFIILHKKHYEGQSHLGLINTYSFTLGTLPCDILQPEQSEHNILTFLRLLRANDNNLIFHLDNLESVFFKQSDQLYHLNANYIASDIKLLHLLGSGSNPIIAISDDLLTTTLKDEYAPPTGINFSVLLKAVATLTKIGAISNDLSLLNRNDLVDKIPLELLVKLSNRDGFNQFHIYRKNNLEISVNESILKTLDILRSFISSCVQYTEKNVGKIDLISFDTVGKYDNMTNEMLNLDIIPSKYSKKTIHLTGDPTIFATKFFMEKDIEMFIKNHFNKSIEIELYKDNTYNDITE